MVSFYCPLQQNCKQVMFFFFICQVADCLMSYSNLSNKDYIHGNYGSSKTCLSCSTPFIAISFCSSCHLRHPLCTYSSGFWFQIELELIFQLNLYPFVGHKTNLFGFWYYFSNTAEHFRKHWVNAKYIYFLIFLIEQSAQKAKNSLLTVSCFSVLLPCLALFLASQSSACRWSRGCKLGLQSIPKESLSIIVVMYFFFPPNFLSFWMTFKKVKPFLSESKATSFM